MGRMRVGSVLGVGEGGRRGVGWRGAVLQNGLMGKSRRKEGGTKGKKYLMRTFNYAQIRAQRCRGSTQK